MEASTSAQDLENVRAHIDALDDDIARLLSQRLELVKEAAGLKRDSGEGAVSGRRERGILGHGAELEHKYDLPAGLMQDLQRRILRQSYIEKGSGAFTCSGFIPSEEHQRLYPGDDRCRVCLVGGKGGMGRFFRRYLEGAGYVVSVVDTEDYTITPEGTPLPDSTIMSASAVSEKGDSAAPEAGHKSLSLVEAVSPASRAAACLQAADWCVVSVPIDVTVKVIRQIAPLLRPDCVLSDLTSVKEQPLAAMMECHQGPVMGLHPMFGPDTFSLVKQVVVMVCGRMGERSHFIGEQLRLFGARVVSCTAREHDEAMRVIQALRHFTTIAYGNFLKETFGPHQSQPAAAEPTAVSAGAGENGAEAEAFIERLLELSSPIYHLELMMVGRLFAQDPYLYCDIISASYDNLSLISQYVACAERSLKQLQQGDRDGFISSFKATTEFFGRFSRQFLRESADVLALVQDTRPVESGLAGVGVAAAGAVEPAGTAGAAGGADAVGHKA